MWHDMIDEDVHRENCTETIIVEQFNLFAHIFLCLQLNQNQDHNVNGTPLCFKKKKTRYFIKGVVQLGKVNFTIVYLP